RPGAAGGARAPDLVCAVRDRHGCFGAGPVGAAVEIDVEERVAHDHETFHEGAPEAASNASSKAPHRAWTIARCASCTVAVVSDRTAITSSARVASGFGAGPVIPQTVSSSWRAALAALTMLWLVPLVDRAMRTSPGRPCARTCRAKYSCSP